MGTKARLGGPRRIRNSRGSDRENPGARNWINILSRENHFVPVDATLNVALTTCRTGKNQGIYVTYTPGRTDTV